MSSNVSAIMRDEDDLLIRFHGGEVYRYFKQGHHFDTMMKSNSKGRYVWQYFRWRQVNFRKEGSIITPSKYASQLTYEQIGEQLADQYTSFNIPLGIDTSEDILKTLINLYSKEIDLNKIELFNVVNLLKGISPNYMALN